MLFIHIGFLSLSFMTGAFQISFYGVPMHFLKEKMKAAPAG
jgi:hypothetical protein